MPKVSIICPIHNTEEYLPRAIDSFVNQTFEDIEIILVNDDSTDSCQSIIDKYAVEDKRIRPFYRKHRKGEKNGYTSAVNMGRENAYGEYIIFPDSDDYLELNAIEKLYTIAKDTNVDIVKGSMDVIELNGQILELSRIKTEPFNNWVELDESMKYQHFCPSCPELQTMLIKKDFQKDIYFFENAIYMDATTQFKLKAMAKSFVYIDDKVYTAVARQGSLSRSTPLPDKMIAVFDELELFLKEQKVNPDIWPYFGLYQFLQFKLILNYLSGDDYYIFLKEFQRKLRTTPLNIEQLNKDIQKEINSILNMSF